MANKLVKNLHFFFVHVMADESLKKFYLFETFPLFRKMFWMYSWPFWPILTYSEAKDGIVKMHNDKGSNLFFSVAC